MGTPAEYFPDALDEDSILTLLATLELPTPKSIISPKVVAEYHSIYFLEFDLEPSNLHKEKHVPPDMVLRVAGPHLPSFKTTNEAAVMSWLKQFTKIPVPRIIKYDSTCDNPIGHEYILLERASGQSLNLVYNKLTEEQRSGIIDQLIDILVDLHAHPWNHIGGLVFSQSGNIIPGRVLEETFWQVPDIQKYWTAEHLEEGIPPQTVDSLNISGPYYSYVDYISAHLQKYEHAIEVHRSLTFMRPLLPRIKAFISELSRPVNRTELNDVKLRLSHKDLHFANIMYDQNSGLISSILDWEFAGVVPFTRWNPSRAFLWTGSYSEDAQAEKSKLWEIFSKRCEERGVPILQDQEFSGVKQESMQKAANFLRAIVEVCPRGQKEELAKGAWKDTFVEQLTVFGI